MAHLVEFVAAPADLSEVGERHGLKAAMAPAEPEQLAEAVQRGDEAAFELLHARFGRGVQHFVAARLSCGDEQAEELAQRAWVAAWRALRDGKYQAGRARFSTFLYAITWNVIRRWRRERGRLSRCSGDHAALVEQLAGPTHDPGGALHFAALLDALRACAGLQPSAGGALDDFERELVCRSAAGDTERELADAHGVAPSTINARKQKAMRKLRVCLKSKGFAEPAAPAGDR